MVLIYAEKTQSQRSFIISLDTQNKLAPYLDRMVKGAFSVTDEKIVGASDLTDTLSDPLNAGQGTTLQFIKEGPCPE